MTQPSTRPVTITGAEQALSLAIWSVPIQPAGVDKLALVVYAGSMTARHGPCWHVGWCHCEPCATWTDEYECDQRVLVTLDGQFLLHVRPSSFAPLDPDDERVPAILRPCQGCTAEPGQECDPSCLADQTRRP